MFIKLVYFDGPNMKNYQKIRMSHLEEFKESDLKSKGEGNGMMEQLMSSLLGGMGDDSGTPNGKNNEMNLMQNLL